MSWSDRRYDEEVGFRPRQPSSAVFVILGSIVGAHVLKALFVSTGAVSPGFTERWFGVSAEGLASGYLWQVVTYMFVHGGMGHLFWNAIVLFMAGRLVEALIGSRQLLIFAGVSGTVGVLGVFMPGVAPNIPTVGASGVITGLWTVAWCVAPNLPVNVFVATVRLKWLCGFFLLMDVLRALGDGQATFGTGSGTAYWTHLWGAFGGFACAFLWPRFLAPRLRETQRKVERKREAARAEREMSDEQELDRILAKINEEGMAALSDAERQFLKRRATKAQDSSKR